MHPRSSKPKRRFRSFSLRALLIFTAFIAVMLAWVVLPRDHRRLAINSLHGRGVQVELTQDPTDSLLAAMHGQNDWKEPSWMTHWLHRNLPAAYLRPVDSVTFREPHTPTEADFQEICRLGSFDWLFFLKEIDHPECLRPLIRADNVYDALHFSRHEVNAESLRQLSQLKNVRRIFFQDARVSPEGLRHLTGMRQLTTLDLTETGCGDEGLTQVAKFANLNRLRLVERSITAKGFEQLASPTLRKLEIWQLDESKLAGLSKAFSKMQNLNELYLYKAMAATGLEAVADLPNLQRLDLTRSAFTDDSLEPLSGSKSLISLELSDTHITEVGIMHLLKIATLKNMRGFRVQVSEEALMRLKAARPDVQFDFGR
jgi:hypothetical protein